jgi:hypothetical protein
MKTSGAKHTSPTSTTCVLPGDKIGNVTAGVFKNSSSSFVNSASEKPPKEETSLMS